MSPDRVKTTPALGISICSEEAFSWNALASVRSAAGLTSAMLLVCVWVTVPVPSALALPITRRPPLKVVPPVYPLTPVMMTSPTPSLVSEEAPVIVPLRVMLWLAAAATVNPA